MDITYGNTQLSSQGASTITQQLARNFFLTPEKKLMRKIKEAFLAIRIEKERDIGQLRLNILIHTIYRGCSQNYASKNEDEKPYSVDNQN